MTVEDAPGARWRVRVDLFAEDGDRDRASATAAALRELLRDADPEEATHVAADQGLGVEGHPVVGLLFWVRANDVGGAAVTALETARRAGADHGVGPRLYDVVVIPSHAVVRRDDPRYPSMPD